MRLGHRPQLPPRHLSRHRAGVERRRHARVAGTFAQRERIGGGQVVQARCGRVGQHRRRQERLRPHREQELPRPLHGRVLPEQRHAGQRPRHQGPVHLAPQSAVRRGSSGDAVPLDRRAQKKHAGRPSHGREVRPRQLHFLPAQVPRKPVHRQHRHAIGRAGASAGGGSEKDEKRRTQAHGG